MEIDFESLDNGNAQDASASAAGRSGTDAVVKAELIKEGKVIYQKYLDGGYVDAEGIADMQKAPESLQKEAQAFADKVEKAGVDLEEVMEEIGKLS